jgi:hypothetical protein
MISQSQPENKTVKEKFDLTISQFPINSFWKYELNENQFYLWVHGYELYRSEYLTPMITVIAFNNIQNEHKINSWDVYQNNSDYKISNKEATEITKEEFELAESKLLKAYNESTNLLKFYIIEDFDPNNTLHTQNKDLLKKEILLITNKHTSFEELMPGQKILYSPTKSVIRIGELIKKVDGDELKCYERTHFIINERQVTNSAKGRLHRHKEENNIQLMYLISDFKEEKLNSSDKFWIISDEEFNAINNMIDEAKNKMIELNS